LAFADHSIFFKLVHNVLQLKEVGDFKTNFHLKTATNIR